MSANSLEHPRRCRFGCDAGPPAVDEVRLPHRAWGSAVRAPASGGNRPTGLHPADRPGRPGRRWPRRRRRCGRRPRRTRPGVARDPGPRRGPRGRVVHEVEQVVENSDRTSADAQRCSLVCILDTRANDPAGADSSGAPVFTGASFAMAVSSLRVTAAALRPVPGSPRAPTTTTAPPRLDPGRGRPGAALGAPPAARRGLGAARAVLAGRARGPRRALGGRPGLDAGPRRPRGPAGLPADDARGRVGRRGGRRRAAPPRRGDARPQARPVGHDDVAGWAGDSRWPG